MTDTSGNPVAGAQLTVTKTNVISPLPIIYTIQSDGSIFASANPFNSDSNGEYVFAVESGSYSIEATGSSAVLNISKTITQFTPSTAASTSPVAITLQTQTFLASASWTCPAGVTQATVTCVAGGAGGRAGASGFGTGGDGGGGGATVVRQVPVTPGVTYAIVVGSGGIAGVPSLGAGGAGGNTTFGTLVTANGAPAPGALTGSPGTGTTAGYGGPIGASVIADTSEPIINGRGIICSGGTGREGGSNSAGTSGNDVETHAGGVGGGGGATQGGGGGGGATPFGAGGAGGVNTTNANIGGAGVSALANSGAGGGGGASGTITGGAGGAGGSGLCIVEWIS